MPDIDEEDKTMSETSMSLLNTPDMRNERAMFGNRSNQKAYTPLKEPSGSLLRIVERK